MSVAGLFTRQRNGLVSKGRRVTKIAIIYYSSTGHTYQLAQAVEEGAHSLGAETRLRKVRELAPDQAIASNQGWQQHLVATQDILEAV